jgi:hypothetical protein
MRNIDNKIRDKSYLTPKESKDLKARLEKYERGEMKFKSWEDVLLSIRVRSKT